jgi:DNA-binding XRE family transcriptional regulator
MPLPERVHQLRNEHGWSQAQLAEHGGGDADQISRYEHAKIAPSAEIIIRLAQALNVSCDYLLVEDAPPAAASAHPKTPSATASPPSPNSPTTTSNSSPASPTPSSPKPGSATSKPTPAEPTPGPGRHPAMREPTTSRRKGS